MLGFCKDFVLGTASPDSSQDERKKGSGELDVHALDAAIECFAREWVLGEGGFGKVYLGFLEIEGTNQLVAIKKLNPKGEQGTTEFLVELIMLRLLQHPNLINLKGYCAEGDQRMLVYEFMPLGSLHDHLHGLYSQKKSGKKPLDWNTRMKIAAGAAKGLEYLHDKVNPPVIFRDMKSTNILLDIDYNPKLSDFGMAILVGPVGDSTHVLIRVLGTHGYCAPEYLEKGELTLKCEIYSFGVVLLELITGRKAFDGVRDEPEKSVVEWAWPLFKDRKNYLGMADKKLQRQFPSNHMEQALAIAAMCVQEQPEKRPPIAEVAMALNYLTSQKYVSENEPVQGNI